MTNRGGRVPMEATVLGRWHLEQEAELREALAELEPFWTRPATDRILLVSTQSFKAHGSPFPPSTDERVRWRKEDEP